MSHSEGTMKTDSAGDAREAILASVKRLRRRWFAVHFARGAVRSAFYALIVGALALFLAPQLGLGAMLGIVAGIGLLGGLVLALRRMPHAPALAKAFDDQAGLADRVSSSVELFGERGPMVAALLDESAQAAGRVVPKQVYPLHVPREGWLLPLPVALLAAVLFLPGLLNAEPEVDPRVDELISASADELEEMISRERDRKQTPRRKEYIAELEKLLNELEREKVDKKDALAEVAKLLEKLKDEKQREQKNKEELEKLLESLRKGERTEQLAESLKNGEYEDAMSKLEELLDDMKKQLEEMKKNGASKEEIEALEKKIQELKELKAKLMKLLQIDMDLAMMGDMIEFLEGFEGDLGDISDLDIEFIKHDCDCEKPGL